MLLVALSAQAAHTQPRPLSPASTPLPPRMTVAERAEFYQRVAREERR